MANLFGLIYGGMGAFMLLLAILALVGGIFALRRKLWGLALAGSISGTMTFMPTGIAAIIFTSMSRPEFLPRRSTSIQNV